MKHDAAHRKQVLAAELDRATDMFAELVEDPDPDMVGKLRRLAATAERGLADDDLETAERACGDSTQLVGTAVRRQPVFILAAFERAAGERFLAIDPDPHDRVVGEGRRAAEHDDLGAVDAATFALYRNRAESDGPSGDLATLAGLTGH